LISASLSDPVLEGQGKSTSSCPEQQLVIEPSYFNDPYLDPVVASITCHPNIYPSGQGTACMAMSNDDTNSIGHTQRSHGKVHHPAVAKAVVDLERALLPCLKVHK